MQDELLKAIFVYFSVETSGSIKKKLISTIKSEFGVRSFALNQKWTLNFRQYIKSPFWYKSSEISCEIQLLETCVPIKIESKKLQAVLVFKTKQKSKVSNFFTLRFINFVQLLETRIMATICQSKVMSPPHKFWLLLHYWQTTIDIHQ